MYSQNIKEHRCVMHALHTQIDLLNYKAKLLCYWPVTRNGPISCIMHACIMHACMHNACMHMHAYALYMQYACIMHACMPFACMHIA